MLRRFCVVSPLLLAAALLGSATSRASASPVYQFDVTTYYSYDVYDNYGHYSDPDTGYFTVTNNGTTKFTGNVGVVAVGACAYGPYGPDESETVSGVTLNPGDSILIVLTGDSSNNCGFNGTNGAQIFLTGQVINQGCSQDVDLRVYDKDIHSGSPQTNPCSETTDAYVLQGGSPSGCDTGDDFEVSQAPGHYSFVGSPTYTFSGFLQPIDSNGQSIFKLGSTVPVKFTLSPNPGASLTATLSFAKVTDDLVGSDVEAVSTAAATTGNLFRYDASSGQYIFNWGTKGQGLTAGTYQLKVTLDNCQTFTIQVSLKK